MFVKLLKGSLFASFFLLMNFYAVSADETILNENKTQGERLLSLSSDPLWHLILNLKNNKAISDDTSFFIANNFTSALDEASKTVELFNSNIKSVCSFPARLALIQKHTSYFAEVEPATLCSEYKKFIKSVPSQQLRLIYASENVTSASSMMGHIMLRLDGINENNIPVKHGITFFTELDSLNVPKILFDTLVTGKEGVFKVAPYKEFEDYYLYNEQRNVWSYTLDFSANEKHFLKAYIWELGQQSPKYFFHKFNCATVTQLLVAVAKPDKVSQLADLLTPLDVVKFAKREGMVTSTQFIPSNKWRIATLSENIASLRAQQIAAAVADAQLNSPALSFLEIEYARALNLYLHSIGEISKESYESTQFEIAKVDSKFDGLAMDVSGYHKPTDRQDEGYVGVGLKHFNDQNFIRFRAFPVARRLSDDNRSIIGETELLLADFELSINIDDENLGSLYLEKAMLYQMISRIPVTQDVTNLSSSFNLGLLRVPNENLQRKLVAQSEFGIGVTKEVKKNVGLFADLLVGAGGDSSTHYIFAKPVLGAYLYTKYNNKLDVKISRAFNQYKSNEPIDSFMFGLHQYGLADMSFDIDFTLLRSGTKRTKAFNIMFGYRF